jgi:uncharacterized iron-regulated membrane protein
MNLSARAKRLTYLIHRWTGVAACVLMALWFVSGIVMLFIGYPKLTPWERLQAMPALQVQHCCVSLDQVLAHSSAPDKLQEIVLTSVRNQPYYRLREGKGNYLLVDARSGALAPAMDRQLALAGARAFVTKADAHYLGRVHEDRWTHARSLDPHRPLHQVQMDDADHTLLYLSDSTGQVVMDAPRAQRMWNYVGAWLHWLYMFRDKPVDPVWSWIVIVLSAFGTLTAITGTLAGIWRWRFRGRYKSGARTPYREAYLHWHHIIGLSFAAIIFTWIFSGLMSMNPLGIFDARGEKPNSVAYRGATPGATHLSLGAAQAISLLNDEQFRANEIEWRVLDGRPYLLARNAANGTRLIVEEGGRYQVRERWNDAELLQAATQLLHAPIRDHQVLEHYDTYYYGRQQEAMMGAAERRLPALRVRFEEAHQTWVHLDPFTGDIESSSDQAQRTGRWLFSFLHSWDLPPMLQAGAWRDAILILLSLGGLALSITGIVIGWRRLRVWFGQHHRAH